MYCEGKLRKSWNILYHSFSFNIEQADTTSAMIQLHVIWKNNFCHNDAYSNSFLHQSWTSAFHLRTYVGLCLPLMITVRVWVCASMHLRKKKCLFNYEREMELREYFLFLSFFFFFLLFLHRMHFNLIKMLLFIVFSSFSFGPDLCFLLSAFWVSYMHVFCICTCSA